MHLSRDITSILLILFLVSCGEHYNDLVDYGYKGKVRKVVLVDYLNPKDSSGEWYADKEPRFTKTTTFDDKGMAIEESFVLRDRSYTRKYTIKNGRRIACSETGDESDHSTYSHTNSAITEKEYDSLGSLIAENVSLIDKNKLTRKEEFKTFDASSVTSYYIYIYAQRVNGYVSKYISYDSVTHVNTPYENVVLDWDNHNNPTKILVKKDSLPESLRILRFEYR